ncbi:MAG: SMP-30/gluconolactonase/LRE family protein, partial [Betaproteobacteria bacterium]
MRLNPRTQHYTPSDAGIWAGRKITSYSVGNRVGEAPSWHPEQQRLYWIDVRGQQLFRLDPTSGSVQTWDLPEVVGALALCEGGVVCLALVRRLVKLNVDSGQLTDFVEISDEPTGNRLNDGKVSPSGRWFVFGSMDDRPQKSATGALYRVSSTGLVLRLHSHLKVCNGIAWNASGTHLYFSDSSEGVVFRAAWDDERGQIGPVETFARLDEAQGRPDGGVVDDADRYWSAGVSAGCLN